MSRIYEYYFRVVKTKSLLSEYEHLATKWCRPNIFRSKKAFDNVNHNIFLKTQAIYGIRG